ncbi:MAG: asparagine synthase (glutamine-hydrolyzing) [Planctomycetota bacterium]|nr:MAG: asparagine synthase (glutamine-hydrolyzing) [Planctomycetota bacterium]
MCGICGILNTDPGSPVREEELRAMTEALRHRGPDDSGILCKGGAGLGVRRLSIIDIEGGHQPIPNENGTVFVVLNGEIYNYMELARALRAKGHAFRTRSDTEVLVHLYEEYGEEMPAHLNGMFAFAVWDADKRRLFLVRDRLGQKPLYYWRGRERVAFASEIKSFLKLADFRPEIQAGSVSDYLTFGYVPHPSSILQDVGKLPPAHCARVEGGGVRLRRYWQPMGEQITLGRNEAEERLRDLLDDAVRLRLVSDVPLGAFLSGGIDSSIIAGLMAGRGDEPVRTFTIGFDERRYDERPYARMVADRFGTKHVEEVVRPDVVEMFEKLVWHLDEPLGDSSAVPTFMLSEMARRSVKVALSGDGGDECFLGYPRHSAMWLSGKLERLPRIFRGMLFGRWWHRVPAPAEQKNPVYRWKRFVRAMDKSALRRYYEWISLFDEKSLDALLASDLKAKRPVESGMYVELSDYSGRMRSDVGKASALDLEYYLPCDLMAKVDRTSMAHGLEVRSPFLDHRVVEFGMNLPDAFKIKRGRGKRILRSAFADLLPREIAKRGKMGFAVPVGRWLREELREMAHDLLMDGLLVGRHIICREALETLLADHMAGRADNGQRLWALLVLEKWLRLFQQRV